MAPDGSRFMAGFTMYDTATLAVIAQQNNANAPFTFTAAFNTTQNVGGSIFTPDGTTLYSAFNTAPTTNPAVALAVLHAAGERPHEPRHPAGHQTAGKHRRQDRHDSATARTPGASPIPA